MALEDWGDITSNKNRHKNNGPNSSYKSKELLLDMKKLDSEFSLLFEKTMRNEISREDVRELV